MDKIESELSTELEVQELEELDEFGELKEELRRLQPLAGPGIIITDTGAGQRYELLPQAEPEAPGETYSGPFKVRKKDSTSVTVLGYDEEKSRYARNYVTLGLTRIEVDETDIEGISTDSWIYLDISWGGSAYGIALSKAASIPEQSNTHYYIPLAFVKTTEGAVSGITQVQFGPVEGSGRVF
ncbi:MAG: hypothetical protein A2X49_03305 [Lentisphaerae bacterium GWF2_52_8]|nr:MAG: hypothetical protein A2X49_03305 [Lentisphaerae bacterium GWF2_52_8]